MSRSKSIISVRKNGREVQLDLHGYSTETALYVARAVVETAWERGCDRIVMIHGAKHVASPAASSQTGQGRTKWALRQALSRGEYNRWAEPPKSGGHDRKAVSDRLSLALKPNSRPDPGSAWPEPPEHEYDRERRRD